MKTSGLWIFFAFVVFSTSAIAQDDMINLGPLYEPDPVTFTFDAPGWYLLLFVLSLITLYFIFRRIKKYFQNAYRRAALQYLENIKTQFEASDDTACLKDIFILLKQVALKAFGRDQAAKLYGDEWLLFLESKCSDTPFKNYQKLSSKVLYQDKPISKSEFSSLYDISKKWIKYHA